MTRSNLRNWARAQNAGWEAGFDQDLVLSQVMAESAQLGQDSGFVVVSGLISGVTGRLAEFGLTHDRPESAQLGQASDYEQNVQFFHFVRGCAYCRYH